MAWDKSYGGDDGAYGMVAVSDGYVMVGDISGSSLSNGSEDVYLVKADLNGDLVWARGFGGKKWDIGHGIARSGDGFVVAGVTQSFGNADAGDFYLIRTDRAGNLVWSKTFGGEDSQYAYGVATVADGYIVVGKTRVSNTDHLYVVKTDLNGNLVWEKTYGSGKVGYAVTPTGDGYVITGTSSDDSLLLTKIGPDGSLMWQSQTGFEAEGRAIAITSDGYAVTGQGYNLAGGMSDIFLVKTDKGGKIVWKKYFGGSNGFNNSRALVALPDGYALAGSTETYINSVMGDRNVFLIRTNLTGDMVWNATYGRDGSDTGYAMAAVDGGYVIAGKTNSFGYGMLLLKTNSEANPNAPPATPKPSPSASGKPAATNSPTPPLSSAPVKVWDKALGSADWESGSSIVALSDGFVIAGTTSPANSDNFSVCLVKTDRNGNQIWNKSYSVTGGERAYSIVAVSDGLVVMGVSNVTQNVYGGGFMLKTDFSGNLLWKKDYWSGLGWDSIAGGIAIDDGFVMVGDTGLFGQLPLDHTTNKYERDLLLMKTDKNGNQAWLKEIGGTYPLRGYAVAAISDGYVVTGDTFSSEMVIFNDVTGEQWPNPHPNPNVDVLLARTDRNGNVVWQKTFGGTGMDTGYAVTVVKDGYVIAGVTNSTAGGNWSVYLLKTDLDGKKVWERTFDQYNAFGGKSVVAVDDGYVVTGSAYDKDGEVYLLKADPDGNLVWYGTYGGTGSQEGNAIIKVSDGFVVAGDTYTSATYDDRSSDFYLLKTDSGGSSTSSSVSGLTSGMCCVSSMALLILLVLALLLAAAAVVAYLYWKKMGKSGR